MVSSLDPAEAACCATRRASRSSWTIAGADFATPDLLHAAEVVRDAAHGRAAEPRDAEAGRCHLAAPGTLTAGWLAARLPRVVTRQRPSVPRPSLHRPHPASRSIPRHSRCAAFPPPW